VEENSESASVRNRGYLKRRRVLEVEQWGSHPFRLRLAVVRLRRDAVRQDERRWEENLCITSQLFQPRASWLCREDSAVG